MLKGRKMTAVGLVVFMLVVMMAPMAFAGPASSPTVEQQENAQKMVEHFRAYHEPFSAAEQAEIKVSLDALKALSDAQWKTLATSAGLKTPAFIAKFDNEAQAEAALISLLKDTYQILYSIYNETVLEEACLEFIVDQAPTINRIYDGQVTPDMLVALVQNAQATLSGVDISGNIGDQASDYWNVVYGTGKHYIYAVDNVAEQALETTIAGSVLKTKMTALNWGNGGFVNLHEKIMDLVDSDFRAMTLIYDSVLRKHSVLTNVSTGNTVPKGQDFILMAGQSITLKFEIFGKNVSVPFGSYIKLPLNGGVTVSTNQAAGTFTVTAVKELPRYEMVVRRGVVGSDSLVNTANIFWNFFVTSKEEPTQEDKKDYHPNKPSDPLPPKPPLGATVQGPTGGNATVTFEEQEKGEEYQLHLFENGQEAEQGSYEGTYDIKLTIPTDFKDSDNVVLFYLNEEGEKVIVPFTIKNGVITAQVNYVGTYYLEKISLTDKHIAYLVGDDQGLFKPNANMTRAEVAQMFFNLLENKNVTAPANFKDVDQSAWYAKAVNVLAASHIINGYDGEYRPNDSITREEFTTIAVKFVDVVTEGKVSFSDVEEGSWSYNYILTAASKGWISGYEDGTFKPYAKITRAEVTTMVNKMLNRIPDETFIDKNVDALTIFPDANDKEFWAYYQIVEATNGHDCEVADGEETWTTVK